MIERKSMNKAQVDDWRNGVESRLEELTVMNAKQNSDIHYIKDSVDEDKKFSEDSEWQSQSKRISYRKNARGRWSHCHRILWIYWMAI